MRKILLGGERCRVTTRNLIGMYVREGLVILFIDIPDFVWNIFWFSLKKYVIVFGVIKIILLILLKPRINKFHILTCFFLMIMQCSVYISYNYVSYLTIESNVEINDANTILKIIKVILAFLYSFYKTSSLLFKCSKS